MKSASVFPFLLLLTFLISCKKDAPDPVTPAPKVSTDTTATAFEIPVYLKALVNGSPLVLEGNFPKDTQLDSVINGPGGATQTNLAYPTAPIIHHSTIHGLKKNARHRLTIYFVNFYKNSDLYYTGWEFKYQDKAQFLSVFSPGHRNFKYDFADRTGEAVAIEYLDPNGITWITSKNFGMGIGPGFDLPKIPNYRNHRFEVISATDYAHHPELGKNLLLAKISFDGYLYNQQGDSLHVANGEFQGFFHNFMSRN